MSADNTAAFIPQQPQYQQQQQQGGYAQPQVQPQAQGQYYQQQPQYASQQVAAPGVAPYAQQAPLGAPSTWVSGVCDCFDDVPSCCEIYWCHPCQNARQYNMLTKSVPEVDWLCCIGLYCADLFTGGCGTIGMACHIRQNLRRRYNITGGDCEDFCCAWCCPWCVICQNYREMSARGQWPQGFCTSAPYTSPAVQQPPPQQPQMGGAAPQVYQAAGKAPAPLPGTYGSTAPPKPQYY